MDVFEAHPDAVLVGTLCRVIDHAGRLLRDVERWPLARARGTAPLIHGTIMFRRAAFDRAGGYRAGTDYWEDADLFPRLAEQGRIFVVPDGLYSVRYSRAGTRVGADPAGLDRAYGAMSGRLDAAPPAAGGRIPPRLFVLSGSPRLWAGERSGVLRRLLASGDLRFDRATLGALAWALWAEISPASLRLALRARGRLREWIGPSLRDARWVELLPEASTRPKPLSGPPERSAA
jgi:hypothetical protein